MAKHTQTKKAKKKKDEKTCSGFMNKLRKKYSISKHFSVSIFCLLVVALLISFLVSRHEVKQKTASVLSLEEQKTETDRIIARKDVVKNMKYISFGEENIKAYFTENSDQRARGLSVFDTFSDEESMLFAFDRPGRHSFWMREMKFPIDMVWLDENKQVIHIKNNARPEDFPETYKPDMPALYVLEFNAGYVAKKNIQKGDQFNWE